MVIMSNISSILPSLMTAKEAAIQSKIYSQNLIANELSKLNEGIRKSIHCGDTSYTYYGNISEIAKIELEKLGYIVEERSYYNDSYTTIKW